MGNHSIELCPVVNKGKAIDKSLTSFPSMSGYEVPLVSATCTPKIVDGWEIPLVPEGLDPCTMCNGEKVNNINWFQRFHNQLNPIPPFEPIVIPEDYWVFECSIPQGFLEGTCPQCFHRASKFLLIGDLGFNTSWVFARGGKAKWTVARKNLPFPGEPLKVITVIPGDGDFLCPRPSCTHSACGAPSGSCYYPTWELHTTGTFCIIADGYFATPTWTSGKITNYYTDALGWSDFDENHLAYPNCSVYGDRSLKYSLKVEKEEDKELTSAGFSAYIIGSWVSLRKLGESHFEPFDDDVLGVPGNSIILPWHISDVGG